LDSDTVLPRKRKPGGLDDSSVVGEKDDKIFLMKQELDNSFINVNIISESYL